MFRFLVFILAFTRSTSIIEALSVEEVSRALALDRAIVIQLKTFLNEVSNGTHDQHKDADVHSFYINKFIREHEQIFGAVESSNTTDRKGVEAASDPIKSLILTRRLSKDWSQLLRMSNIDPHHSWKRVKSEVLKVEKDLALVVEEEDLDAHTNAFARVLQIYKLEPSELIGLGLQLHKSYFSTYLKTIDVALVGGMAIEERFYGAAVELLTSMKQLVEKGSDIFEEKSVRKRSNLLRHLNHLIYVASNLHDLRLSSEGYRQQRGMFPNPLSKVSIAVQREEKEVLTDPVTLQRNLPSTNKATEEDLIRFAEICRGHTFLQKTESARLRCRLDNRGSPYLVLMPAKVEEHSLNPKVVTFHQALTPIEIKEITDTARPVLEQAQILSGDSTSSDTSFKVRSSYTAWLREERLPMLKKLRRKIEALTGMSVDEKTKAAEILQVNLYAAGGYYIPHVDAFNLLSQQVKEKVDKAVEFSGGDRIATFMFYMNNVEAGGQTAFPRIGVGVKPSAGNAVFWSNLLPDGFEDTRTLHGACPVLKGIKWVSNKWIRYDQQFQHKPCPILQTS